MSPVEPRKDVSTPAAPVGFTPKPAVTDTQSVEEPSIERAYAPLIDTFRLYAGWLLAWYAIVYLLGAYQFEQKLPFAIPFIEGLFLSPLVLKFAFGTFLFLLLSSLHRALGRGIWKGILLTIVWLLGVAWFVVNA